MKWELRPCSWVGVGRYRHGWANMRIMCPIGLARPELYAFGANISQHFHGLSDLLNDARDSPFLRPVPQESQCHPASHLQ
jgi:hypothetical protein